MVQEDCQSEGVFSLVGFLNWSMLAVMSGGDYQWLILVILPTRCSGFCPQFFKIDFSPKSET